MSGTPSIGQGGVIPCQWISVGSVSSLPSATSNEAPAFIVTPCAPLFCVSPKTLAALPLMSRLRLTALSTVAVLSAGAAVCAHAGQRLVLVVAIPAVPASVILRKSRRFIMRPFFSVDPWTTPATRASSQRPARAARERARTWTRREAVRVRSHRKLGRTGDRPDRDPGQHLITGQQKRDDMDARWHKRVAGFGESQAPCRATARASAFPVHREAMVVARCGVEMRCVPSRVKTLSHQTTVMPGARQSRRRTRCRSAERRDHQEDQQ